MVTQATSEGSEEGLPMMMQRKNPSPQQLKSAGIRDDRPFSQLPYAPRRAFLRPSDAAGGGGYQSDSDATPPRWKRSANTLVGSPLANPIKLTTSVDNSRTKNEANRRQLRKGPDSAPHQAVKPVHYAAYLTFTERGGHRVQHTTRPEASPRGDAFLFPHPADPSIGPTLTCSPNRTGNGRPSSDRSSVGTGQSVYPSKYLFAGASPRTPSQRHVTSAESLNSQSSSSCYSESSDGSAGQSGDETAVFQDALSTMHFRYCASPIGFKAHRMSIKAASSSRPPPSCLSPSAASISVPTPEAGSQKVHSGTVAATNPSSPEQNQVSKPEQLAVDEASDQLRAEDNDQQQYNLSLEPRSSASGRRPRSFVIPIPGQYLSICESSSEEGADQEELLYHDCKIADHTEDDGPKPDAIRHDLSANTPSSSLIDVLNRWEKIPRTAEVPTDYLKQLKQALVVYEEQHRLVGPNVYPSDPSPRSHTLSSGSYEPNGSQQSRSSGRYATSMSSYGSYGNESRESSTHHQWTPFSEGSRIPASRQLTSEADRLSAELQEPSQHPTSVSVLASPERMGGERKARDGRVMEGDGHPRRRNLQELLGVEGGIGSDPTTACKSLRPSPRKLSLTSELTRTVRAGFFSKPWKLPPLVPDKRLLIHHPHLHPSPSDIRCTGSLSDWEFHLDGLPRLSSPFVENSRRSSSCGPLRRPLPPSPLSQLDNSISKKFNTVRFQ